MSNPCLAEKSNRISQVRADSESGRRRGISRATMSGGRGGWIGATISEKTAFLIELSFGQRLEVSSRMPYGPGGWLAHAATPELQLKFGQAGLWILLVLMALVSFMLATEMAFYPALRAFGEWVDERQEIFPAGELSRSKRSSRASVKGRSRAGET